MIIGTLDWASTRLRGQFACPTCGTNERFRLRASRPFLTIYFIPVVPIGGLQEFVQCSACKDSFETNVLASRMLPDAGGASGAGAEGDAGPTFESDLLKVISLMMIEDGHVTENEIRIARRLYENMAEQNLSREDLGRSCGQVKLLRLNVLSFLATASKRMDHQQKLLVVQAMFAIAGADGQVSPGRLRSLVQSQQVLGLEEREFQSAVEATAQWLT